MYLNYWQLASKPFESGANRANFFPCESHQAALLKLRYAVEFFATLFPGSRAAKRRRRFAAALERLQDGLGDLNDIAVHEQRMAAIGLRRRRTSAGRAFAAGLLAGREDARTEAALAAVTEALEDLAAAKPFWR